MEKRGRVLRDPHRGPGLLMVEGRQYPFLMEGVWRSEVPAKPGLVVNVEFDIHGKLNSITAVPPSQTAKAQAEAELSAARKKKVAALADLTRVLAAGFLFLSWCLLVAFSIQLPFIGKVELTFWQVLGYLNADLSQGLEIRSNSGAGIYGLLTILVLAGPFLHRVWKDRRAYLGGFLPLTFVVLTSLVIRGHIQNLQTTQLAAYGPLQDQIRDEVMGAISFGLGTYLSLLLVVYFAAMGATQFRQERSTQDKQSEVSREKAA